MLREENHEELETEDDLSPAQLSIQVAVQGSGGQSGLLHPDIWDLKT